ncbi:Uncharacterised protein [Mycobacteroides abscessus subsp. abscessus]|nr:Uncharacterised protein [Mycobacteroides abscessus subsp. abscessus]
MALTADVTSVATTTTARTPVTAAASATTVTALAQRTTSRAGRPSLSRALVALPAKLPIPAAAPTIPSIASC